MSRSQFIANFAIGFGCCLGMVAVALLAALAVINTGGDARAAVRNATPTAQQMKQALEFISRNGASGVSGGGAASSGGGAAGAAGGPSGTSTPETTPQVSLGGGASSSAQTTNNVTAGTTPQPTTTSGSSNVVAPTPVMFTPPTIVPIQPLAVPTVSSAPAQVAGGTPTTGR